MSQWFSVAGGNYRLQPITFADTGAIDAFARLRISDPYTIWSSKQITDDPDILDTAENFPLYFDNQEVSGGGTATAYSADRASTILSVSNTTAGNRTRQTKRRFNYQAGKSQLFFITFGNMLSLEGITKRIGLYDDNNGLYLQSVDGATSLGVRSYVSGSAVDTLIPQASWNLDTLDGSGDSGITLDLSKVQIFFGDFEWLGVGRIRLGFVIDGIPIYVHEVNNANNITSVYMSTPNLPIRCEIENDGTGGADTIEQICTTIISEGGIQPEGVSRIADPATISTTIIQAAATGSVYAVAGIRLKSAALGAEVYPNKISLVATTNDDFMWSLHLNPTLGSALTFANIPQSAVQYAFGDTADPGIVLSDRGYVLDGGFVSTSISSDAVVSNSDFRLGSLINGTSDVIVLAVSPLSANLDIRGMLGWKETFT